jgi:Tfp pilus assembly protein PilZ
LAFIIFFLENAKEVFGLTDACKVMWDIPPVRRLTMDIHWYVYQNSQQLGPFATPQILQMLSTNMITQNAYLFKIGWKEWRPIEDTFEELGYKSNVEPSTPERRAVAPRATINGRVIVHNNGQLIIGSGVNVSASGIFVETTEQLFTIGERLKLSVRIEGFVKAFNVVAHVVRFNSDPKYPVGFGLAFENLDQQMRDEIQRMVEKQFAEQKANKQGSSDKVS